MARPSLAARLELDPEPTTRAMRDSLREQLGGPLQRRGEGPVGEAIVTLADVTTRAP